MTTTIQAEETTANIIASIIIETITAVKNVIHTLKIFIPTAAMTYKAAEIFRAEEIFKAVQEDLKAQAVKEISP